MPVTLSKGTQSLVLAMGYENNSLSLAIPDASVLTLTSLSPLFTLSEGEGIGSSAGTSTVTGVGSSLAEVVGSATGAATVAGAGAATKDVIGSS